MRSILVVVLAAALSQNSQSRFNYESPMVAKVLHLVKESCVVLVTENATEKTTKILAALKEETLEPNDIPVLGIVLNELETEKSVKLKIFGLSDRTELVVLDRKYRDRTCLMTANLAFTELVGRAFVGLIANERSALKFINEGCGTFLNLDGSLNAQGLHKEHILANLFSIKSNFQQKAISMLELAERCGNLKEFFRTGSCEQTSNDFCSTETQSASVSCSSPLELPKCERVAHLPSQLEFFEQYLKQGKPVIFEGAAQFWPAFQTWTNQFFRKNFGQKEVHIKLTPPEGDFEGVESRSLWNKSANLHIPQSVLNQIEFPDLVTVRPEGRNMKMVEFLDLIENKSQESGKSSAYLEYTRIKDYLKGIEADAPELEFVKNFLELRLQNIWLSDGNTLGKLHMDQYDNLLGQISGRKQVILFEPWENTKMYEGHIFEGMFRYENGVFHRDKLLESTSLTMAPVDITKPDFKKFPNFADTYPMNCTIEEGDVLFLPSFWWHEVQSYPSTVEHRNLAVNFWYEPFLWKEFPCQECEFDINMKYRHLL